MPRKETYTLALEAIILGICKFGEPIVTKTTDDMGVLLTVSAIHPQDMPNLIGRQGQTINAIRIVLRPIAAAAQARVNIRLEEPEGSTHK